MRYIFRLALLMIFITTAAIAMAKVDDQPSIRTSVSKKRIFVGDRIRYNNRIVSNNDLEIELPMFKESKIGEFEIKDSGRSVKSSLFGKKSYLNWLDLTSYYVGKRIIPSIEIKYRKKGESAWKQLKTDEVAITVETVLPAGVKLTDIKDIKGVLYPFNLINFLLWTLALVVLIFLLVRFLLKMIFKKAPPKLPHEIALEEIEAASKQFAVGGTVKEYYVRISDAIRRYIECVFQLKAPEMTTQEFLMSLGASAVTGSRSKLPAAHKDLLVIFMEACDLVKFARFTPARSDMETVYDTARKFVEETKEVYMKSNSKA